MLAEVAKFTVSMVDYSREAKRWQSSDAARVTLPCTTDRAASVTSLQPASA
jgi:hypothetical protein